MRLCSLQHTIVVLLAASVFTATTTTDALKILLTNNNAIDQIGLQLLKEGLSDAGHDVHVYAPSEVYYGAGMALTLPVVNVTQVAEQEFAVAGFAATCVLVGISALNASAAAAAASDAQQPLDLVVSGITDGYTSGSQDLHSGTLGGAMTGMAQGIPSIAFMTNSPPGAPEENQGYFESVRDFAVTFVNALAASNMLTTPAAWPKGVGLKVIYPNATDNIPGVVMAENNNDFMLTFDYVVNTTTTGGVDLLDASVVPTDQPQIDPVSDASLVEQGYITALPILADIAVQAARYNENFLTSLRQMLESIQVK